MSATTSAAKIRYVAVTTTILQVGLAALALWCLWNTKASSDQFVLVHGGERFHYRLAALLGPAAITVLFGSALASALLWRRYQHARRLFALLLWLSLAVVTAWWAALNQMGAYKFFVASGTLPPNEIFGSIWPLAVVEMLFSLAALLGLIPLACLALRRGRANP